MAKTLEDCNHCKGKKNCSKSGGRSCDVCLRAAGRGPRDWGVVRCSFCGGRGKLWVETEPAEQGDATAGDDANSGN